MRSYTVKEIDDLRSVVGTIWDWGSLDPDQWDGCSRACKPDERARCVEEEVRTYMLAGITADDIRKEHGK